MDNAERVGLGVAAAGHVALFALLSASFLVPKREMPLPKTMDVSLVDQVALEAAAPAATEAPAASKAPEVGPIEDSPPPAPAEAAPAPAPPEPAPPTPAPKPAPAPPKPAPAARPKPAPKPAPTAKPQPKQPAPAASAKPTPAKPAVKPAPARPARPSAASAAPAKPTAKPGTRPGAGTQVAANNTRPRGGSLGDIMKGIVAEAEPKARGTTPSAAKLDAVALAGIQDAIRRQIQPCADRQVDPGPGANQIATTLNLRFNADGTLSATPTVVRQGGIDDENGRYKQRVVDLGIAALRACSPLRLPPEFYRTAAGGWSNINFIWKLR